MTDSEADVMYAIVTGALSNGGKVPTAKELALSMQRDRPEDPSVQRFVNQQLHDLQSKHPFLYKPHTGDRESKSWHLDTTKVVTEAETAFYLISLVEACKTPEEKVRKADFHSSLSSKHAFTPASLDWIVPSAIQNAYAQEIMNDYLRPGPRTYSELPYLSRRAKDYPQQDHA